MFDVIQTHNLPTHMPVLTAAPWGASNINSSDKVVSDYVSVTAQQKQISVNG